MLKRFLSLHDSANAEKRVACMLLLGMLLLSSACSSASGQVAPNQQHADSNFVLRSGAQLLLHGQPFRFAGANMYWLGLDENITKYPRPNACLARCCSG
jgi:mannan endo-1,4-beta-mannosidase